MKGHRVTGNQRARLERDEWIRREGIAPLTHHVFGAWLLNGALDSDRLTLAFDHVVAEHPGFRSSFADALRSGWVNIAERRSGAGGPSFWSDDAPSTSDRFRRRCERFVTEPFDLDGGPLLRVGVATGSDGESVLMVAAEHLVCDGISLGHVLKDLLEHCESSAPPGHTDYVEAMESLVRRETEGAVRLAEQFTGDRAVIPAVPAAILRPSGDRTYHAAVAEFPVEDLASEDLLRAARRSRVSPTALCLAGLASCWPERTGEPEFRALMAVANRPLTTPRVAGWFANSVVVGVECPSRASPVAKARTASAGIVRAVRMQDVSFHELKRLYEPAEYGRLPSKPVLSVDFRLSDDSGVPTDLARYFRSKYPLASESWCSGTTVSVWLNGTGIILRVTYDDSAIDGDLVAPLADGAAHEIAHLVHELQASPSPATPKR